MMVLVVGSDPSLEAMGRKLAEPSETSLVWVKNGPQAAAELNRAPGACCHIIYALDAGHENLHEALELLKDRAPRPTLTLVSEKQGGAARPHRQPQLVGAFERNPKGLQPLGCNLVEPNYGPPGVEDIIYEYQAPCRPSRRAAG